MQTVGLSLALLDLRLAVAGQVAQRADRLRRHEARPEQPGLEQLAQPRRVADVGLAARHLLDVAGVDQQQLELVLEDRPGGLPVDPGGLHRDLRHAVRLEPVAQPEQSLHRRSKPGHVLLTTAALARGAHARGHPLLVHIQRRRALNHRLHGSPFSSTAQSSPGEPWELTSLMGALKAAVRGAGKTEMDAAVKSGLS